jgi:hypothetical protein
MRNHYRASPLHPCEANGAGLPPQLDAALFRVSGWRIGHWP